MTNTAAPPLAGIKIVEFGIAMAGPFCALTLADFGADVIKIEAIGEGDPSRRWGPDFPGGVSHYFASANRNKRSLALDLENARAVEVVRRLVVGADVVVDNFGVGALDRVGLGAQALMDLNPRLIYCGISGFGATGPRAREAGNDVLMQAYAGNMSVTGEEDGGPCKAGISIADIGSGLFGAIGVLLALAARHRTGRGQYVDTSLLDGQVAMLSYHVTRFFATGKSPVRQGSGMGGSASSRAYRAKDHWIVLGAMSERMWEGVCRAVGRPEWNENPEYHLRERRRRNAPFLIAEIGRLIAEDTAANWIEKMTAEGVPCSPVNTIENMLREEQVQAREMAVRMEHPTAGTIRMAGLPIKFSETPGKLRLAPPLLGEHTEAILNEQGYSPAEIEKLLHAHAAGSARVAVEG